jgi:S1-C subfamily serine protease
MPLGAQDGFQIINLRGRPRLGIRVETRADAEADKVGARIESVTQGGPADKAGLKAGDIVTKFNGKPLGGLKAEDEDDSGPGMKLISLAHTLDPGDTAQIEYRRGNDTKKVAVVAERLSSEYDRHGDFNLHLDPPFLGRLEGIPDFGFWMGFGDLDLVEMNPDLGEYFGTKEGVLVTRAPGDSTLPLKAGDVILTIDGRKIESPSHAMRILRSYEPGESPKVELIRKQKRMTVSWKVNKERRGREGPWHRERSRVRPSDGEKS